uniref:C2H2-type domain-containing protein n=1 Tax=Leersia perrieri TaxID=77586 RepID=A0A0D9XEQ7_9ORYZ
MGTEVAPVVVDMRALSQSDLVALAAASPYGADPHRRRGGRDADVLPPPKIDRAVFNESAGSRKQTFSRHRVATNLSHSLTPATASSSTAAAAVPSEEDSENRLIVFHLQRLFAGEDPSSLAPPQITPQPQPQTLIPPAIAAPVTPAPTPPASNADLELMNRNGVAVDLAKLAELVDPYEEEMRRRTAGLVAESELLGFMNGLEGQWGSRRRRRKFVDASMFGDHLPNGWKLLLGLRRKERVVWINCRRYVSPSGRQFASFKEISSHLMSLLGYAEAKTTAIQSSNAGMHELNLVNPNSTEEKQSALPVTSMSFSSQYGDPQGQVDKNETQMEKSGKECQKCNLTFQDQSAYVQHQLSFHQRKAKRRKVNKSGEIGVDKNETCVTQECQKTSEDKLGHIDHTVAAVRNQGQTPEKLSGETISGDLSSQPSMAPVPFGPQEMDVLTEQGQESSAGELLSGHRKNPVHNMSGVPQQEKGSSAGETVTGHHEDPIVNSNDHKIHDGAFHNAEEPHAVKATSKISTGNSVNFEEIDSTKDIVLSSTDCTQNVNKPEKTCSLPEVPNATDAQSESKRTGDPMEYADLKPSKNASEHCDLLDDKFSSFPEGANFNGREENSPLSATLNEPDLNSIGMEVDNDDDNVECKYGNSNESAGPENADCRMTALKDHEINTDVRIRDVNLNSCLDTMSSPVSGANYEASDALDDANRSSIIAQCFGASSADDNACKEENFINNQNSASKAEDFVNQNNNMMYQPNLTMDPISPAQINVDCFNSSCSMTSEIKDNSNRREETKEQLVNPRNITSNEAGFDVEAYSNIFSGAITESSLAHLNSAMNMKADYSSCYSLSDLNTLTGGSATDEIDMHSMRNTFVNSSTSRNEPNEHCTLDFDIKGSMLEALEKSDSDLENQYNDSARPCEPQYNGSTRPSGTSGSIDDFMSLQTNFGSLTSLVRSVEGGPMSRIIQDQLGFGVQKPQMYPSFEEQLRMASAGAPQFGSMNRHNHVPVPVPVPEPTLMLGYAPHIGSCPPVPVQLGWDLSMSKMVGGCVVHSVCVWCNTQFQHFGTVAEQQADSLGFICPACKEKISGHLSMLNNSSSQL